MNVSQILKERGHQLRSNQIEFSLVHRIPESAGLIKKCHDMGVDVLAYSPLAQGRLTDRITCQEDLDKLNGDRYFGCCTWEQLEPILKTLQAIAKTKKIKIHGKTENQNASSAQVGPTSAYIHSILGRSRMDPS